MTSLVFTRGWLAELVTLRSPLIRFASSSSSSLSLSSGPNFMALIFCKTNKHLLQWEDAREGYILVLLAWKGVRKVANFLLQFFALIFLTLFWNNFVLFWQHKTKIIFELISYFSYIFLKRFYLWSTEQNTSRVEFL